MKYLRFVYKLNFWRPSFSHTPISFVDIVLICCCCCCCCCCCFFLRELSYSVLTWPYYKCIIRIFIIDIGSITGTVNSNSITLQVPDVLEDCISNYTYTFQNSTGTIDPTDNTIMLSTFNIGICTDPVLILEPIILGQDQPSLQLTLNICTICKFFKFRQVLTT